MFGKTIDYWLLRPLVHSRGRADEATLDSAFSADAPFDKDAALARLRKLHHRFEGHLTLEPGKRYLDVGCGRGDLDIAMVLEGAGAVTGIDIVPRNIEAAKVAGPKALGDDAHRLEFICGDIHTYQPEVPFDAVLSHEALEHIDDPGAFIKRLGQLVAPGGSVFLAFGPLFHSALGDHMDDFFRVPVPWRGVLFNEEAILKLRAEFFRPGNPVTRFEDISIGMNRMRFSEFLTFVEDAELSLDFLGVNPQFRPMPLLDRISKRLSQLPVIQDYWTMSVYAHLRRP